MACATALRIENTDIRGFVSVRGRLGAAPSRPSDQTLLRDREGRWCPRTRGDVLTANPLRARRLHGCASRSTESHDYRRNGQAGDHPSVD
jgi:hypothetical protein